MRLAGHVPLLPSRSQETSANLAPQLDGTVVLFDVETNGLARYLRGHVRQIQSLSWSQDGRYLASASQDFKVIVWDLSKSGEGSARTVRFNAPVYCAELHPLNP